MAKRGGRKAKDDFEEDPSTRGHNVAHINKTLQEVAAELNRIDSEMDELKAERKGVRARIKALGIKLGNFDITMRLRNLEGDERASTLDDIKVCFEALNPGESVDWVTATRKAAA